MTQKIEAQEGIITKEMRSVARQEGVSTEWLREKISSGRIVIPANRNHKGLHAIGIGEGLRIKVNTNIGTSSDHSDLEEELKKLEVSIQAGTDTVMDLSTGGASVPSVGRLSVILPSPWALFLSTRQPLRLSGKGRLSQR